VIQRDERRMALEREVAQQRKAIAKEEDYIRRNIAGRKSAQAGPPRATRATAAALAPPGEADALTLTLEIAERGGDQALVADRLTVAIGQRVLVRGFSAVARRAR